MALLEAKIPSSGLSLPRLGLGTYRSFDVPPGDLGRTELPAVLRAFYEAGGRLVDSSPMYGQAEAATGALSAQLGVNAALFLATKVWTNGAQGEAAMRESLSLLKRPRLELMQVHNLRDFDQHWPRLLEAKASGRFQHIGITHYHTGAYDQVERVLKSHPMDFLQIPYSLAERTAEQRLIPLAADKGVAVIANEPFDQGGLFRATAGRALPAWVAELGIKSWAEYFLKFIFADPRVQFAIPATSKLAHLQEFLPGGSGPLPDAAQRRKMQDELSAELG